ncbi:pantetheine-phosphate adenylyltransferase [Massilia sp. W12]|uniref:pantetheine-phosphate adenylyltransferase n=1 Tax=Massilia sp. W12 TaxID=3126507 RepID=UPI0030CCFE19
MNIIGFSGTLDPITNGHMWVIGEARAMADKVLVFLSENTLKTPQFPAEERRRIILESTAERGWDNIEVMIVRGDYTARTAKRHGVDYLIRGIRNTSDFDYENLIQQTNVDVLHGAKTVFVMPPRDLGSVSSSFVRALQGPVGWHWHMKKFVPPPAYRAWIHDWLRKEWMQLWQYNQLGPEEKQVCQACLDWLLGPQSYGAPERAYHNCDHLVHGLTELRTWAANNPNHADQAACLKKAFWFHDAVYHQGADAACSDEEASAQAWQRWLAQGLPVLQDEALSVAQLIRVTDHFQEQQILHPAKDVMLSADLSILGQDEDIYNQYAQAIAAEYAHVAPSLYRERRVGALRHLLQRNAAGALYGDAFFASQYQAMAQQNLQREIAQLSAALKLQHSGA